MIHLEAWHQELTAGQEAPESGGLETPAETFPKDFKSRVEWLKREMREIYQSHHPGFLGERKVNPREARQLLWLLESAPVKGMAWLTSTLRSHFPFAAKWMQGDYPLFPMPRDSSRVAGDRNLEELSQLAIRSQEPQDVIQAIRSHLRVGKLPNLPWSLVSQYPDEDWPTIQIVNNGRVNYRMREQWEIEDQSWQEGGLTKDFAERDLNPTALELARKLHEMDRGIPPYQPNGDRYQGHPVYETGFESMGRYSEDPDEARGRGEPFKVRYLVALALNPQQEQVFNRWLTEQ